MMLTKQYRKIVKKFEHKVKQAGGFVERSCAPERDGELLTLYVYNRLPMSDETCVAAIDCLDDRRYGHPTFNVDIYNEVFNPNRDNMKQVKQLQLLTVKCANKLVKKMIDDD